LRKEDGGRLVKFERKKRESGWSPTPQKKRKSCFISSPKARICLTWKAEGKGIRPSAQGRGGRGGKVFSPSRESGRLGRGGKKKKKDRQVA